MQKNDEKKSKFQAISFRTFERVSIHKVDEIIHKKEKN